MQLEHKDHKKRNNKQHIDVIALDVSIPMNVGSLFRVCDSFAVNKLYLAGNCAAPPSSKINKTSRSTVQYVNHEITEDCVSIIKSLKQNGHYIIALEQTERSVDLRSIKLFPEMKLAVLVGSENYGIPKEILDLTDKVYHIPMHGNNSSMNLATATAIALWEITNKLLEY